MRPALNKEARNILNDIPKRYRPIVFLALSGKFKYLMMATGRGGGKTNLLAMIVNIWISLFTNADIVVLRKFKNLNRGSTLNAIEKWRYIMAGDMPTLLDFKLNKIDLTLERKMDNGDTQTIHFLGTDKDGINKIRGMEKAHGFISLVWEDEAEDLHGVMNAEDLDKERQAENDKNITLQRRWGEYKDLDKHAKTLFAYTFNNRVHYSLKNEDFYKPYLPQDLTEKNINKMLKEGMRMAVVPEFENGNGAIIVQASPLVLLLDDPKFHPDIATVKTFERMKLLSYDVWLSDCLGFIMRPIGAVYKDYMDLFLDELPKSWVPTIVSVDSGIKDTSAMVIRARGYHTTEDYKFNSFSNVGGAIDSYTIKGTNYTTDIQKGKHISSVAKKFINYLMFNYLEHEGKDEDDYLQISGFKSIWLNKRKLRIVGGHKDEFLIFEMKKYIDSNYPQYKKYIKFYTSKKLTTKFKNTTRTNIIKELITSGYEFISHDLTPDIRSYIETLTYDSIGKHERLQDVGEAYEIGLLLEIKERLKHQKDRLLYITRDTITD